MTATDHEQELEVIRGVVTYLALTGGHGKECGSPLWNLAREAGWTLEDFVDEVLHLGGDLPTRNIKAVLDLRDPVEVAS